MIIASFHHTRSPQNNIECSVVIVNKTPKNIENPSLSSSLIFLINSNNNDHTKWSSCRAFWNNKEWIITSASLHYENLWYHLTETIHLELETLEYYNKRMNIL